MNPTSSMRQRARFSLYVTIILQLFSNYAVAETPTDRLISISRSMIAEDFKKIRILVGAGADVNAEIAKDGTVPLLVAASLGYLDIVSLLVRDDDIMIDKAGTNNGLTALHLAAMNGHPEVLRVLINYGADVDKTENNHGATALHFAAYGGHKKSVSLLIEADAQVNIKDASGSTAIDHAEQESHKSIVKQLQAALNNDSAGKESVDFTTDFNDPVLGWLISFIYGGGWLLDLVMVFVTSNAVLALNFFFAKRCGSRFGYLVFTRIKIITSVLAVFACKYGLEFRYEEKMNGIDVGFGSILVLISFLWFFIFIVNVLRKTNLRYAFASILVFVVTLAGIWVAWAGFIGLIIDNFMQVILPTLLWVGIAAFVINSGDTVFEIKMREGMSEDDWQAMTAEDREKMKSSHHERERKRIEGGSFIRNLRKGFYGNETKREEWKKEELEKHKAEHRSYLGTAFHSLKEGLSNNRGKDK